MGSGRGLVAMTKNVSAWRAQLPPSPRLPPSPCGLRRDKSECRPGPPCHPPSKFTLVASASGGYAKCAMEALPPGPASYTQPEA